MHPPARKVNVTLAVCALVAGFCVTLGVLIVLRIGLATPARGKGAIVVPDTARPSGKTAAGQPSAAALDAQWLAYSDRSTCADWSGGDGVSAIRLSSSQVAWFFADTYLGPAGPAIGFSAPERVHTQLGRGAERGRAQFHAGDAHRRWCLQQPQRPRARGAGRGAADRRRRGRPGLGCRRDPGRRHGREVLQRLPAGADPVRPGEHDDRQLPGQPAQRGRARAGVRRRAAPGADAAAVVHAARRRNADRLGVRAACRPAAPSTSTAGRAPTRPARSASCTWPGSAPPG